MNLATSFAKWSPIKTSTRPLKQVFALAVGQPIRTGIGIILMEIEKIESLASKVA